MRSQNMIFTFSEQYRVRVKRDECGEIIVQGGSKRTPSVERGSTTLPAPVQRCCP
jgi:hypothetical protein